MEKKTDFRSLSNKAKVGYIWDYYRWPIVITIAIAAFVISLAYHYISYKEPLLNVIMFNTLNSYNSTDEGFNEFLEEYGYDPVEQPVSLSSNLIIQDDNPSASYQDYQALTMMVAAGGQDLFFGTGNTFMSYASQGAFIDLRTVLSEETLDAYKDQLIYITDEGSTEPYPCAVNLKNNEWLSKNGYYNECYFGIFFNSEHLDTDKQFAEFLLNY